MNVGFLIGWMMVFLRSLGIILQLPLLAGRPIPIPMRVGLSVCIATLLSGVLPVPPVPAGIWPLVAAVAGEVMLGLALGWVARLVFTAVEMAGRIISTEIGLSASPGMGVPEPASEPLAALLSSFAIVMFFLLGGHQMMLTALARSFHYAPPGLAVLAPASADTLIRSTGHVIELGLRIAAPFIAMNFLVTLSFSALGRAVPKMNVFVLSFSARALCGLALLATAAALIARYLFIEFGEMPIRMLQLLKP